MIQFFLRPPNNNFVFSWIKKMALLAAPLFQKWTVNYLGDWKLLALRNSGMSIMHKVSPTPYPTILSLFSRQPVVPFIIGPISIIYLQMSINRRICQLTALSRLLLGRFEGLSRHRLSRSKPYHACHPYITYYVKEIGGFCIVGAKSLSVSLSFLPFRFSVSV